MKRALFALAVLLLAGTASAQISGGIDDGTVTGDLRVTGDLTVDGAVSSTGVNTAPSGCSTPGYAWTDDTDTGLCFAADDSQDTWSVDYMALALGGEPVAQVYTASGGEYFFEVQNPNQAGAPGAPKRMFRVRGDADLTRIYAYAPTEAASSMDHVMTSTSHTLTYYDAPDDSDFVMSMDGIIKVGNGSASIPSYSFQGDPDTGWYYGTDGEASAELWGSVAGNETFKMWDNGEARYVEFFGTYTDSSNYEGFQIGLDTAGQVSLRTTTAGTGTDNMSLNLFGAGTGDINAYADVVPGGGEGTKDLGADGTGWQTLYLGDDSTGGTIIFEGIAGDGNEVTLAAANASSDTTFTIPNVTGTALVAGVQSIAATTTFNMGGNTFTIDGGITQMQNVAGDLPDEGGVATYAQVSNQTEDIGGTGKEYWVTLTDNTATTIADIELAENRQTTGGTVNLTATCTDATNYASGTLTATFNCTTWNAGSGNPSCAVTEAAEAVTTDGTATIDTMTISFSVSQDYAAMQATVDCGGVTPSVLRGYAHITTARSENQGNWSMYNDATAP